MSRPAGHWRRHIDQSLRIIDNNTARAGRPSSLQSCRLLTCLGRWAPTGTAVADGPQASARRDAFTTLIMPGRRQGFKCFTLPRSFVELSLGTETWNQLFLPICDSQLFDLTKIIKMFDRNYYSENLIELLVRVATVIALSIKKVH
eukprot:g37006.t1